MQSLAPKRTWDVLLIGGASASGKTALSLPLSRLYQVDLVRVDDFQVLLEALTTPESHPPLHYWKTHPNRCNESVTASVKRLIDVGCMLTPGLAAVIDDHLAEDIPMILEGDFILPELAASFTSKNPRVKAIFMHEPSREQILQNYFTREASLQEFRADVSHAYGNWLVKECSKLGIPIVESRPWDTLIERVVIC